LGVPESSLWLYDFVSADTDGQVHQVERMVVSAQTRFQKVDIYQTPRFGKILTLDNRVQSLELDEFIYHEAFIHPAMVAHPAPRSVFVIGGGEGACLRELLRHNTVRRALMVDIDGELVEFCRQHLPTWHQGAFDDPRSELRFEDARKYVAGTGEKFDVIIVDLSEPAVDSPAYFLFTVEFYHMLDKVLAPGGRIVFQSDAPAIHASGIWSTTVNTVRQVFPHVLPYVVTIPGFGSEWGFTLASREPFPPMSAEQVDSVLAARMPAGSLRFYDGITHQRIVSLPLYMRRKLAAETRFYSDANPPAVEWGN